ncbi:membrane protein of unknown function (plasmid) [Sterolibacterium denitrificans]|uniref:Uncharacterized protein n=1 Tax=Sterolibacterium denitrificans TaxID=157592 RepID=A0A7Z7HU82_9PROT|nr:hypothetical protein [Sterolibacterium denitrificans]SMB33143.1 membrane protein of unknown function [Sterolibacterium denitrificans]
MSNIIKFPKPKGQRALPALELDAEKIKKAMPKASTVKGVFAWLFLLVRLPLFLVMYWLRLPIIFLCNLVSIPMLLAWLFALYAFPEKSAMVWGFGIASFAAFVVSWAYDFILMAISPQDMMMTL